MPTRPVILDGVTYAVPGRLDVPTAVAFGKAMRTGELEPLLVALFGAEHVETILSLSPPLELDDLRAIIDALTGGPGNSRSSTGSSSATVGPTSTPTT